MDPTTKPISIDSISGWMLKVPADLEATLPLPTIAVTSLIVRENLPPLIGPSRVDLPPAESCVVDTPANWTEPHLFQLPIPPRAWLRALMVEVNNCLHASTTFSLRHPDAGELYFPVWVISFWHLSWDAVEER